MQTLAEDHPSRVASQHALANTYRSNGQVKEAIQLLKEVVRIEVQTLAEDRPSRVASQHSLAIVFWDLGQHASALDLMRHVVKIRRRVQDDDHPDRNILVHTRPFEILRARIIILSSIDLVFLFQMIKDYVRSTAAQIFPTNILFIAVPASPQLSCRSSFPAVKPLTVWTIYTMSPDARILYAELRPIGVEGCWS
jgi:hypothetical protein